MSNKHSATKVESHGLLHDQKIRRITGIVFAVVSAGFGALVSQLSGRGSKAIVDRRHARQAHRK